MQLQPMGIALYKLLRTKVYLISVDTGWLCGG